MTDFLVNVPHAKQLDYFQLLSDQSLHLWPDTSGATATLLNVSENIMYRIETNHGPRAVLRINRQNNNLSAIQSEFTWMSALQNDGVMRTPDVVCGIDGHQIQTVKDKTTSQEWHLTMFEFIEGCEPDQSLNMLQKFTELGELAASMHTHSMHWQPPPNFRRGSWNTDTLLGNNPMWGRWQDAPGVSRAMLSQLQQLSLVVQQRLLNLGQEKSVYGLIHADMRAANLLVHENITRLIDFDDCGFGWYLYDFAAAISFIEDHPQLPDIKSAWLSGYHKHRTPTEAELQEIDTLIMLRRLSLLAWMATHRDVQIVQKLERNFAAITCDLAAHYLARHK